jgi:hypothetical protein
LNSPQGLVVALRVISLRCKDLAAIGALRTWPDLLLDSGRE